MKRILIGIIHVLCSRPIRRRGLYFSGKVLIKHTCHRYSKYLTSLQIKYVAINQRKRTSIHTLTGRHTNIVRTSQRQPRTTVGWALVSLHAVRTEARCSRLVKNVNAGIMDCKVNSLI